MNNILAIVGLEGYIEYKNPYTSYVHVKMAWKITNRLVASWEEESRHTSKHCIETLWALTVLPCFYRVFVEAVRGNLSMKRSVISCCEMQLFLGCKEKLIKIVLWMNPGNTKMRQYFHIQTGRAGDLGIINPKLSFVEEVITDKLYSHDPS